MESQQQNREENLEREDESSRLSSGQPMLVSNDTDNDELDKDEELDEESVADDELDEDL